MLSYGPVYTEYTMRIIYILNILCIIYILKKKLYTRYKIYNY